MRLDKTTPAYKFLGRTVYWEKTCYGCGHSDYSTPHTFTVRDRVVQVDVDTPFADRERVTFTTSDGVRVPADKVTAMSLEQYL